MFENKTQTKQKETKLFRKQLLSFFAISGMFLFKIHALIFSSLIELSFQMKHYFI